MQSERENLSHRSLHFATLRAPKFFLPLQPMKLTFPSPLVATLATALFAAPFAKAADAAAPATKPAAPAKPTPKSRKAEDASTPAPVNAVRQKAFLERAKDKGIQLVFLGDSITDFWQKRGKAVWEEYYAKHDAADFGVSGEHTEHTLGHLAGGILDGLHPKAVVIMIGTNNIGHIADEQPEWTAGGIRKIVKTVHEKLPDAKVAKTCPSRPRFSEGARRFGCRARSSRAA